MIAAVAAIGAEGETARLDCGQRVGFRSEASFAGAGAQLGAQRRYRDPNNAVPTRTQVAPSIAAVS